MHYLSMPCQSPILHPPVQCFLDRCFKRKYTSKPVSVYDFLERQDRKIFKKFLMPKDIVLNPPATILEKKLVLNLRLTLCALKTLLLIV